LNPHAKFLREGPARIVIFTTHQTSNEQLASLRSEGAEVFVHADERVDLEKMLATLKELGIQRLMVEGGATLNFELLRLGLVDEIMAYMAPLIFGGESAPTMVAGSGLERSAAIPLKLIHMEKWEDDGIIIKYQIERSI
jgi:2,5-diamino-6-(ribosylamino)-4(3H)-pyrimidinone 5'-phosphate reductase